MKVKNFKLKKTDLSELSREELNKLNCIMFKNAIKINNALNEKEKYNLNKDELEVLEFLGPDDMIKKWKDDIIEDSSCNAVDPAFKSKEEADAFARMTSANKGRSIVNGLSHLGGNPSELYFPIQWMFLINKNIRAGFRDLSFDRDEEYRSSYNPARFYNKWRDAIKFAFPNDNMYKDDVIYRFQFLNMPIDDVYKILSEKDFAIYREHVGILRSAYILYTCFGIDYIIDMDVKKDFLSALSELEIFFTRRKDYCVNAGYLKISSPCLYFDFENDILFNDCAGRFKQFSGPNNEIPNWRYNCDDMYKPTDYVDARCAALESALILNNDTNSLFNDDPIVMYSFSQYNRNTTREYEDCDNELFTEARNNSFNKLKEAITKAYIPWIDSAESIGFVDHRCKNPYVKAVAKDFHLRVNEFKAVASDFKK